MSRKLSRRGLLRTGGLATAAVLTGCGMGGSGGNGPGGNSSGGGNGKNTPDPDRGSDSYGIEAVNTLSEAKTVHVSAGPLWEDENILEKTVTLDPEEHREWNQVLTKNKEYEVNASIDGGETKFESDGISIWPGSEGAPDVTNVRVVVERLDEDTVAVDVTAEPPN